MCGIAVAIYWDGAEQAVRAMAQAIAHRGDVTDPIATPLNNTAMVTRRLRIVDAANGQQPQASFDGKILVALNGEIYNHIELRGELERMGIPFRTDCDTEVLANALRAWGAMALKRLSGMFAFVALDTGSGEFLAARDPFGVKPLYVIERGSGFLFCSEIRPLLEASPEGEVMLVPPGHLLTREVCTKFHSLPAADNQPHTAAALDRLLEKAVVSRLPDGLPAAALFSGGIDSTLLVHYARRYRSDLPAYFIGTPNAPDAAFAQAYAQTSGLDLRNVSWNPEPGENLPLIKTVVGVLEAFEPIAVRPAIYAYLISQRVHRDGMRVALCGEGADELFAGYSHLEQAFAQRAGRAVQDQCLGIMHRANLQRLDRCGMRFEVEIREPFLDAALADYALRLAPAELWSMVAGQPRGKQPLRDIYDLYPAELPRLIRDRRKIGFDEGAGLGAEGADWSGLFEEAISDADLRQGMREFADFEIASKEELFCLRALGEVMDINRVPHLKSRLRLYVPGGGTTNQANLSPVKNSQVLDFES